MNQQVESRSSQGPNPFGRPEVRSVAVIGAGLSGLTCARNLTDGGLDVRVFDKARGPGGRMSTRRAGDRSFDHGAQYFTVRDDRFKQAVDSWHQQGIVAPWDGRIAVVNRGAASPKNRGTRRFVGVPGMNAVCRHLALGLDVSYHTRIETLFRDGGMWELKDDGGVEIGRFDAVVVSAPAPQAAALLDGPSPDVAARAASVEMAPCWAVMATFPEPLDLGFDGAFVHNSAISWVARNASKPDRPEHESWVIHASPEWSTAHLEIEPGRAAEALIREFRAAVDTERRAPDHLRSHRWRFALPTEPLPETFLLDAHLGLAACGDWCGGPRVEGAFLSGLAAADGILGLARDSR
jgi:predicted NAD/FAD-dependent oxidoreductase